MRLNLIEKEVRSQRDADRLGVSVPKPSDESDNDYFSRLEMQAIARNELFASAFWLLESGKFEEADEAFAEFLRRADDGPSAFLRATVMQARKILNTPAIAIDGPPETDTMVWMVLDSIANFSHRE
jgi:hypothetical protein